MRKVLVAVTCLLAAPLVPSTWASPTSPADPDPNSAIINERIFNDCPGSTVTTTNTYPSLISIGDANPNCFGFSNLHTWRFSADGLTQILFDNDASYTFSADVAISGSGEAGAGLQIAPWWSDADGYFNCRTTDGEVACFGGRLPFYSFTTSHGLLYVKGTTVHLEVTYAPNGLSAASPATIEYRYTDGSGTYTSGPLPFDEGNPSEDPPYGLWGQLNDTKIGGHLQYFLSEGAPPHSVTGNWTNISFTNNAAPVTHTLTASTGPGGSVSPSGSVVVNAGSDQTFNILPDACRGIADVLVDGASVGPVTSYAFVNVQADHTIHATFNSLVPPDVSRTSANVPVGVGGNGSISPVVTGSPPLTFQWYRGSTPMTDDGHFSGVNTAVLHVSNAVYGDSDYYTLQATNSCGTSTMKLPVYLWVVPCPAPPTITQQPVSQTVPNGQPVSFTVAATSCVQPTFQWILSPVKGTPTYIAGATQPTYSIASVSGTHSGVYSCLVQDPGGLSTFSNRATLNSSDPLIKSLSAGGGCSQVTFFWQTTQPTSGFISYGPSCAELTSSTSATAVDFSGSAAIPRPPSGVLYYRLTATVPPSSQTQSECRSVVFAPIDPALGGKPIFYSYYVQRFVPNDGIPVGLYVVNSGCTDVAGAVEIVTATLNGALPRDLDNNVTLPQTVSATGIAAARGVQMPLDFVFSRSEVNLPSGATATLSVRIHYTYNSTDMYATLNGFLRLP